MMAASTERVRRHRARRRAGLPPLRDTLIEVGRLEAWDDGDRAAVGRATSKVIADFVRFVAEHGYDPFDQRRKK